MTHAALVAAGVFDCAKPHVNEIGVSQRAAADVQGGARGAQQGIFSRAKFQAINALNRDLKVRRRHHLPPSLQAKRRR
jgi:hypothetical protein